MSEAIRTILPTEVDMSWAAENPAANSPVATHLEDYTRHRGLWAEAVQESWDTQLEAQQLKDAASKLLGDTPEGNEAFRFESDKSEWDLLYEPHVLKIKKSGTVPLFLGRTSLIRAKHFKPEAKVADTFNDWSYTYGHGVKAEAAHELLPRLAATAQRATETLSQDTTLDPIEAAFWRAILQADGSYAQVDPAPFVFEAQALVGKAQSALSEEDWLVRFDEFQAHAVAIDKLAPLITHDRGLIVHSTASKMARHHTKVRGIDHSDRTFESLSVDICRPMQTDRPIELVTPTQLDISPATSFSVLRQIAETEQEGWSVYFDRHFAKLKVTENLAYRRDTLAKLAAAHLAIVAIGGKRTLSNPELADTQLLSDVQPAHKEDAIIAHSYGPVHSHFGARRTPRPRPAR